MKAKYAEDLDAMEPEMLAFQHKREEPSRQDHPFTRGPSSAAQPIKVVPIDLSGDDEYIRSGYHWS